MALLNYGNPIRFDFGAITHLPDGLARLGVRRPLLVTDRGVSASGLVDRLLATLPADRRAAVAIYDDTPGNPTENAVHDALVIYQAHDCDGVIGLGGGSSIDLGKAVALLAKCPSPLAQYDPLQGGNKLVKGVAPMVAIPTTAGTGSEASIGFLISMNDGRKMTFANPRFLPALSICDPELTLSLPARLTAATGMDAITHCIEGVLAPGGNAPADGIGLDGLWRGWRNLPRAVADGSDRDARWQMMMAATEGALAFTKGLGAVHSMSHAAGHVESLHLHHGTLNAVILPTVLRFNEAGSEEAYARIRQAMGLAEGADIARAVEAMNERLGIPKGLASLGVTESMIDELVPHAVVDLSTRTNPRPVDANDFARLFREAM